jgi:hypothetical protein
MHDEMAKSVFGEDDDRYLVASLLGRDSDAAYNEKQKPLSELERGGCGTMEDLCRQDIANYTLENCRSCQNEYIALRDAELDAEEERLPESLRKSGNVQHDIEVRGLTFEQILADHKAIYAGLRQGYRKTLPTLLRKNKGD